MFKLFLLLSLSFAMSTKNKDNEPAKPPVNNYKNLELIDFKQISHPVKTFDLSGLASYKGKTIAINDKNDAVVYELNWDTAAFSNLKKVETKDELDFEAVDVCGEDIYVSNEKNNAVYKITEDNKTLNVEPDFKKINIAKGLLDGNKFYEGLALDCKKQIMYLTKEREERHILTYDLKNKKLLSKWNIPETDSWDFSDAKYENGFLYVIERGNTLITKINVETHEVVAKYSYQNFEKEPGYLFAPNSFNISEALLLSASEIIIGFDNNGRKAAYSAMKEYKLKGKNPLIARFKRPKDF